MELKAIPVTAQPAYTWLWNTEITKEGIRKRIDEMHAAGIRAFYVIGEPKNFRPTLRRTHLSPAYLSPEYLELLYYAFSYAKEKEMYTWLYNEGGFPSGMACGEIRRAHPELAKKAIATAAVALKKGECYRPSSRALAAFAGGERIREGARFEEDIAVTEYLWQEDPRNDIQTDNASLRNTEYFLECTHERLKSRFGDSMGGDIGLMFDDEAYMGTWTEGLDRLFYDRYGYDLLDYLPYIHNGLAPTEEKHYRAKSDYCMLCGDLVRSNYFLPMRDWLRQNGMLSTGHLDRDHTSDNCLGNRYGNTLYTLRAFDVPGVDAIWGQIDYPTGILEDGGTVFFPRMASSAARQMGHSRCVSESLAVYGAHVTPERMRYAVNAQAVRGISLFNFMVVSYGKEGALPLQYRPNFIPENPGMDRLTEINEYTARLSHLLQESRAEIDTALYYPARSICGGGDLGREAAESFEKLGAALEEAGVSFDVIDEELVKNATLTEGALVSDFVTYRSAVVPLGALEREEVTEKLRGVRRAPVPCIERGFSCILARKVAFPNGDEGYFLCNTGATAVRDTVTLPTTRHLSKIDLSTGEQYRIEYTQKAGKAQIPLSLSRGEGVFLLATVSKPRAKAPPKTERISELSDWSSYVSRVYEIGEGGIKNAFYADGERRSGLYEWDPAFSGEVTYTCRLPHLDGGEYLLTLGDVRHTATAYIDGKKIGDATLPPYRIPFSHKGGGELTVVVANTAANACAHTDYFAKTDVKDVGPYHARMTLKEQMETGGGLLGPVILEKLLPSEE